MGLNMDKLRTKVIDLFKLHPDCDLTLTYIDEDNDVVTLADDNDLRDAVLTQRLNPLRINALMKTSRATTSEARSQSGSSTPMQSSQGRSPRAPLVSAGIEEAIKSLPEPFHDPLLRLSNDFLSRASASAPTLAELVENLAKVGQSHSHLSLHSHGQDGSTVNKPASDESLHSHGLNVSTLNKSTGDQRPNLNIPVVSGTSDDAVSIPNVLPNASSVDQITADVLKNLNAATKVEDAGVVVPPGTCINLNLELPKDPLISGCSLMDGSCAKIGMQSKDNSGILKESEGHQSGKSQPETASVDLLVDLGRPEDSELRTTTTPEVNSQTYAANGANSWWPYFPGVPGVENSWPTKFHYGADPTGGWGWNYAFVDPLRRRHGPHDSPRAFHRGVQCDGCGMHPIMGPRFKSKVKEDYDLCNVCFSEMGNEADYTRMDRASYQSLRSRSPFQCPSPHFGQSCGMRPSKSKLESRFILDVNVLDGTLMPPGAHFTKIWRMRNDGTVAWPHGTKLVYMSGDRFANNDSVDLEIPESGYPVGGELDVAVDFTAPMKPGRYTSFWRMASPSGQRFGQRVWVVIQVENPPNEFASSNHATLNLNLPPEGSRIKGKEPAIIIDMNSEPRDSSFSEPDQYSVPAAAKFGFEVSGNNDLLPGSNGTAAPSVPKEFPSLAGAIGANPLSVPKEVPSLAGAIGANPSSVPKEVPSLVGAFGADPSSVPKEVPSLAGAVGANPSSVPKQVSSLAGAIGANPSSVPKEVPSPAGANPSPSPKDAASSLYPPIDLSQPPPPIVSGIDAFEMTLLKELEEMGFKEKDLNKKILRKNEYDLAQSLDDLCGFSEWELLLDDLEEMGFPDRELNLKLLKKNGGSIKRAVLDLISGENA
ncbi:hypothetical protein ACLOJK_020898 [Asimina triloba]